MKVRISQNDNGIVKSISVESWSRQRRCWRKTLQHQQQRTNMSHSYIPLSVCSFLFSCITYRRMIVYSLTKNQKVLNLLLGFFFQADNTASNTNFDCWYCVACLSAEKLCIAFLTYHLVGLQLIIQIEADWIELEKYFIFLCVLDYFLKDVLVLLHSLSTTKWSLEGVKCKKW